MWLERSGHDRRCTCTTDVGHNPAAVPGKLARRRISCADGRLARCAGWVAVRAAPARVGDRDSPGAAGRSGDRSREWHCRAGGAFHLERWPNGLGYRCRAQCASTDARRESSPRPWRPECFVRRWTRRCAAVRGLERRSRMLLDAFPRRSAGPHSHWIRTWARLLSSSRPKCCYAARWCSGRRTTPSNGEVWLAMSLRRPSVRCTPLPSAARRSRPSPSLAS